MALPDLTGQNIENTYNRVVQTDGTFFYDGTGSLLNLGGNINTGSFATTGSNLFRGNQTITGSVNISGSLNTNNTLYVSASRVGIGISTPSASLQLIGDLRLASAADGTNALWFLRNSNNNWSLQSINGVGEIWRVAGNSQTFYQVGTFANGLNVTPGGNSTTYGLIVTSGSYPAVTLLRVGVNSLVVTGSNVGIGTLTPKFNLDVASSTGVSQVGITSAANSLGEINFINTGYPNSRWTVRASGAADGSTGNLSFQRGSSTTPMTILQNENILLGTTSDSGARLTLRGSGATSATTTLIVQNATPTNILTVLDNGTVGIGRTPTQTLDIAGTTRMSGSFNTSASGSILTVIGSGSAQPIFTVLGSQGELFSITDSLSGSLFSVNDISGLPILEVFSDSTTLIGDYLDPMLITTKKVTMTNSGSFVVYSLPTASYDTAFFDYSIRSGSNARAGQIMAIQSASSVNYTETTTTDFGSTSGVSFGVFVSGSNMVLSGSAATGSWTIKAIIRGI